MPRDLEKDPMGPGGHPTHVKGEKAAVHRYEKVCVSCQDDFVAEGHGSWLRKHCIECSVRLKEKDRAYGSSKTKPTEFDDRRFCELEGCNNKIGTSKPLHTKYCTKGHSAKAGVLRRRARQKAITEANSLFKNPDTESYVKQERQGEIYQRLQKDVFTREALLAGEITASAVAVRWGYSTAGVTRAMHALLADQALEKQRGAWRQSKRVQAMLPVEAWAKVRGMDRKDPEFEELVDSLVRAYSVFSRRYFNLEGKRPLIKDFHLTWIRSIIEAAATGGKRLILSPPRHGKSETLIRFVVWFIAMDPNIRIGWFCASRDVAQLMLGAVKDILENNETLIKDVLPPGEMWDPGLKSGKPWSAKEIKVAQQSHVGQKSSSLLALGRTSKFLSRDMDIIIIDDLEDYDSTREENQRIYSRNKLAEIGTRKEEHTCEIYIGSRQHPDDIPNLILELENTILQWEVIVNSAHDLECPLDPDDFDAHVECMLFPQVRSYPYLMEKKLEMETLGLAHLYPLRYLNTPVPAEGQVFDLPLIRKVALDKERGLGAETLGIGRLVAGLDPSARGIQASFLWHYSNGVMSMVDLETEQSGGQEGAIRQMREWWHKYNLDMWFYETNSQQVDFYENIKKQVQQKLCHICREAHPNIVIKDHNTGKNKKDAELGISAMAPRYHDGRIRLPYGNNEARRQVNKLLRQLELWTTDGVTKKNAKTDIKMASWFPFEYFLKLEKKEGVTRVRLGSEASYPSYGNFTDAPWEQTQYPGSR